MTDREATAAIRVEHIINLVTGQSVKVSDETAKAFMRTYGDPNAFAIGYQHRLADEWNERHAKPRRYTVRLRGSEPFESFDATSHADQGEWVVFYGTDGEALAFLRAADVISIWREPVEAS